MTGIHLLPAALTGVAAILPLERAAAAGPEAHGRPNILICIADDQSWAHHSARIDAIATQGMTFRGAYCNCPSSSPSRASILTGMEPALLEEGGLLFGGLPAKFPVFTTALREAGYDVAYTGKGYDPANHSNPEYWKEPIGKQYSRRRLTPPARFVSDCDYAANFADFLDDNAATGRPFFFWMGSHEPHRDYDEGIGIRSGVDPSEIDVPSFFPDHETVRSDMADYIFELNWFDGQVGKMYAELDRRGLLENTLIVITSDNGMPFPRAKASLYEYGVHMPLVMYWKGTIAPGREVDGFVSFVDFAPTFLELAGEGPLPGGQGISLASVIKDNSATSTSRQEAYTFIERHAYCRAGGLPYPSRGIHSGRWSYIYNFEPDRWPAGDPDYVTAHPVGQFGEIDKGAAKYYIIRHADDPSVAESFRIVTGKRPQEELYDIVRDPEQLDNLALKPRFRARARRMRTRLMKHLSQIGDPRASGLSPWDNYPFFWDGFAHECGTPVAQRDTVINGLKYSRRAVRAHGGVYNLEDF